MALAFILGLKPLFCSLPSLCQYLLFIFKWCLPADFHVPLLLFHPFICHSGNNSDCPLRKQKKRSTNVPGLWFPYGSISIVWCRSSLVHFAAGHLKNHKWLKLVTNKKDLMGLKRWLRYQMLPLGGQSSILLHHPEPSCRSPRMALISALRKWLPYIIAPPFQFLL